MKWLMAVICLLLGCVSATAQTTFQEQAARLQNINAFLLDFRPASAPLRDEDGRLDLSFDFNLQPSINSRVGNKDEPVDTPSVVPKLRGRYLFGSGFMVGGAIAPGIEYQDYEADFYSVEVGYRFGLLGLDWGLRFSHSDGDVEGAITDNEIDDLFTFTNTGGELSVGMSFGAWHPYAFAGGIDTDTELDIQSDGAHLENTESTYYGGLGVTYEWQRLAFTFEQNITDDYLKNIILGVSYRF
jgi:hypothetical protein